MALGIVHRIYLASRVISALRILETEQFFSTSPAIRAKAASSRFRTRYRRTSASSCSRESPARSYSRRASENSPYRYSNSCLF